MATSLGELFIELGVFADTEEVKKFEEQLKKTLKTVKENKKETTSLTKRIGDFVKGLRRTTLAISAVIYGFNRLVNSLVDTNQQFLNLTRTSDISLSTFQKWNNIGRMFGIKNAAEQIAGLNERLFDLMLTGQGAEGFVLAGINPMGQDATGVMEQLRNRVAGLNDTAASYLLKQMGLDPSMLHLLRLSRQEFEALGQAIKKYQLSETQRAEIQKLNIQLQIAGMKLQYIKDRAILALMPIWLKFIQSLARVAEGLGRIINGIDKFISQIPRLKEGIIAVGAAFMVAFHPILALLGSIYLIIDDIVTYFEGGDSLFGHLINGWKDFQSQFDKSGIKNFFDALTSGTVFTPMGVMTPLIRGLLPLIPNQGASNYTNNYDNRQINVQADIQSNQPSFDILKEINSAQYAFSRH